MAEVPLETNQLNYQVDITHKYVGNHILEIVCENSIDIKRINDIQVNLQFENEGETIFEVSSQEGSSFYGRFEEGYTFIWYEIPNNVPVQKTLNARIAISGNLNRFTTYCAQPALRIRKGSNE